MDDKPKKSIEVEELKASYKFAKDANQYLQLADAFLEAHPEIIYWTERNSTKKGLFYKYVKGLYIAVSTLEVEQLLLNFKPTDSHIAIPSLLSQSKIAETINNIIRRRFFYREVFNPEGVLNLQNGFYLVDDQKLIPHTMNIITTNQLPYGYDEKADCPSFMKVLCEATEGDFSKMSIIQEFAGYCLTRDTKLEKILFLIGAAGSGKSSVLEGISAMLGEENVSCATMDKIAQPRYSGLFIDKIANIATEIPKDTKGFEQAINNIVSGEKITVDTKFIPSYDARPYCKLIFAGNDLPAISDTSDAIFRRMLLVYFNNAIPQDKMDTNLKDRIKKEGSGIFNWALEGMRRLKKNEKFSIDQNMVRDVNALKIQNNTVYYFISENYEVGLSEADYVVFDQLYEHFRQFCDKVGGKGVYKKIVFSKEMRKIYPKEIQDGVKWISGASKKVFLGMRHKLDAVKPVGGVTWEE